MNIQSLDLNLLVVFDALVSELSVTRAAAQLGMSQPAASNALARLRARFGDRLFVRGPKGMIPTPRALELAPAVDAALAQLRAALDPREFSPAALATTLRLATTDDIEMSLLPALSRAMAAAAPRLALQCSRAPGLYRVPAAELQSGALDFAVGTFPQAMLMDAGLLFRELYAPTFVCIARKKHPEVRGRLSLATFCRVRHVAAFYPGVGPGLLDRLLSERGYRRQLALSLPHWLSIPFVVAQSDLIATVPQSVARNARRSLGVQVLRCPIVIPHLPVSLVWHARTQDSAAHRWFRDLVAELCVKMRRGF